METKKKKLDPDDSISKEAEYYDMNHARRGVAVIFNQENFVNANYYRQGSSVDRDALEQSFVRLGFQVYIFNDLSREYIQNTILEFSTQNYTDSDCFVMVFMSHGREGKLLAYDGLLSINTLWDPFIGNRCPTLVNKPKLFFIQACQGSKSHGAVSVKVGGSTLTHAAQEDYDDNDFVPTYTIPNRADFLVAICTIPGYVCWRNSTNGSYFIQALCENLNKHGFEKDLQTLLTSVNRRVAIDFENLYPSEIGTRSKQLPTMISMLIRLLKFTKKNIIP